MKGIGALFSFTYALEADHIYRYFSVISLDLFH